MTCRGGLIHVLEEESGKEIEFEIMIRKLIRKGRKTFIVNFYLLRAFLYREDIFLWKSLEDELVNFLRLV